jgi:hypothetical protein
VTTDDGDFLLGRVGVLDLGDESRGTDNVKRSDTKEPLGVVDTLGLEDLFPTYQIPDCSLHMEKSNCTSAVIGTVELTGLEMIRMLALGAWSAAAFARSRTIDALVLNRSFHRVPSVTTPKFQFLHQHTVTGHSRLPGNTGRDKDNF